MLNISQTEVESRLSFDNPWWNGEQATPYTDLPPRDYLPSFYNLLTDLSVKRAVILLGPRRVGKTVMVHHAIERLLKAGVEPSQVMYLALDTPVYTGFSLEWLTSLMAEMNRLEPGTTRYIFFDEIQYLKEWERHLKSLVDSYPNYRFIATGSAAAALRLKSQESGAGRFTDFMLPPLTFGEYIHFIGKEGLVEADPDSERGFRAVSGEAMDELNREFINYLNFGGYPEAVFSERVQEDPSRFIKSDVIDKVLLRDLPSLYGISDIQELNSLFATLAYNTAQEVEIGKLSQNSGVVANTLARYLEYLEAAFLIKRIRRVDESAKQFKRARGFKVYLTNPSIRVALYGPVSADHEAVGALAETAIYAQWIHATAFIERLYFARWKKGLEVDLVGLDPGQRKADWVVEVKWSDRFFERPADLKGVLAFAAANRLSHPPLITTRTRQGSKRIDGIELQFVPTSLHCYSIGRNVLRRMH
ncbi:ATP-binding protein [Candidatus Thiosymbion oneisti]|uniref:ATP-binding protein n=1 Tax=Candidatus Thiosymbion oneisti TaxID=589554 RepID=UPI000A784A37|nr:ATP-binding protein [Candidatus Thiosymbion oneisti]